MKLYTTKISTGVILLASLLLVSCNDSTDSSANNNNDVVTRSSGPTVSLSAEQVEAKQGETLTLDLNMTEFPLSEGGGVSVQFDASMLSVSNVTINSGVWDFVNKVGSIDNDTGIINDILFSSYDGVSGDSNIASITFNVIGSGSSQISLQRSLINPFSSNGGKIVTKFINTSIQISAATS